MENKEKNIELIKELIKKEQILDENIINNIDNKELYNYIKAYQEILDKENEEFKEKSKENKK